MEKKEPEEYVGGDGLDLEDWDLSEKELDEIKKDLLDNLD
jgi:hypothetical protein